MAPMAQRPYTDEAGDAIAGIRMARAYRVGKLDNIKVSSTPVLLSGRASGKGVIREACPICRQAGETATRADAHSPPSLALGAKS